MAWNGLGVGMSNLWRLADGESRSISPENFTGEKGRGGMATEGTGADPTAVMFGRLAYRLGSSDPEIDFVRSLS